uniref:Uncharacterized protein n=1 Tax=Octactis speculum TaxID=3111310 RepID=A0A7S2GDF9_9STRA|mmetsp:Transcript_43363/g.59263  ORF Transcript_43363/g.59263 Transcript_43363/m.59263 type:complete len:382 (+) Transcript_43363:19-1164(+)
MGVKRKLDENHPGGEGRSSTTKSSRKHGQAIFLPPGVNGGYSMMTSSDGEDLGENSSGSSSSLIKSHFAAEHPSSKDHHMQSGDQARDDAAAVEAEAADYKEMIEEIERERDLLTGGTHPEITRRSAILQKNCQRRIAAAKRFRDLQIENIRGLYDYEEKETNSTYATGVAALKQMLADDLDSKIASLRRGRRCERRGGGSGGGTSGTTTSHRALRSLRVSGRRLRQRDAMHLPSYTINGSLTDSEVRSDLRQVVNDLKQRAALYVSTCGSGSKAHADVVVNRGANGKGPRTLVYDGHRYMVGSRIVVHSVLTAQDFPGSVIQVSEHSDHDGSVEKGGEMLVKLRDGTTVRVCVLHLKSGRLTLSPPPENDDVTDKDDNSD